MLLEGTLNQIYEVYSNIKREIETITKEDIEIMKENEPKENESEKTNEDIWQVEIPAISLIAPIAEGTSQEIMLEYVGHFENTDIYEGNIGLAAHNRGYPINYFSKLKELKKEDIVIYKTKLGTKTYAIKTIEIIEDTNWSYLQETNDNRTTLITCVENKPNQRLCIQGVEI